MRPRLLRRLLVLPLTLAVTAGVLGTVSPAAATEVTSTNAPRDYVSLVNPWVETDIARYFFFQSASNPFGLVKLRPDSGGQTGGATGYRTTDTYVKGFSHIHEWQFAGVQVMPTSGASVVKTEGETGWQSPVKHDSSEVAQPGYHKVHLDRYGITAELTATDRVGLHRYTYDRAGPSEIIINLGGTLGEAVMKNAEVTRVNDQEIQGFVVQRGGSYADHDVRLYFDIRFDRPFDSLHGWTNGSLVDRGAPVSRVTGKDLGAYARFNHLEAGDAVQMKVGLSLTGIDGARKNLQAEMPGWGFGGVKQAAQARWNEMLGRIDVRGGTHQQQVKFYTDLFHVLCGRGVASDVDGKYIDDTWNHNTVKQIPLDDKGRPRFAMYNYDALWLTQWNLNTVLGLAYPEVYNSFVNSQLQMYRDGGLLPRGPVAGNDSLIMTGSPVTSFISGAWNKGIRGFDADLAYEAMLDAHSVGGLFDKGALEYSSWTGAGGIRDYLNKGYVPYRQGAGLNGGTGMTLEYAFQDWTLAQFARTLNKTGLNVAQFAQVTASSQANTSNYAAARAVDGRPVRSSVGNANQVEWRSAGEPTPWIKLSWPEPKRVHAVVLSDRADPAANVNSGTLTFSDGTSVAVDSIPADGANRVIEFPARTVDWVRFEATGAQGTGVGLNEMEAWDDTDVGQYLLDRSRNWRNVYDEATGFVRPRNADGTWLADFDPLSPSDFVEANSWQSTWFTSHDVMGLANLMGGEAAYADKLNYAFTRSAPANFIGSYGQGYVSYGNQPGLQVAHLFNYVGYPWLTQYWVRQVKEKTFGSISSTDGYGHHDEDQGQMGAISALMAIGLFEVTGAGAQRPVYDITSPIFDEVTIKLNQDYYRGDEFRIVTHNNSAENAYIQRAQLDGKRLDNAWFHHDQLADGGTLELWMGSQPNKSWGVAQLPPSESASAGKHPVYATAIAINGPDVIREPFSSVRLDAVFTPADTTLRRAYWSVTEPDGSPTDKATITQDGVLTVNRRNGEVVVTAVNADSGPRVTARKTITLDLDVNLLRGNASRWPGVRATASSEYSDGYGAAKVHDGVVGSKDSGDWASRGERNPWIQLAWDRPIRADRIVLYDRASDDDVNKGTLSFSDGSTIEVDQVPVNGAAKTITFPMKTFDWVRFQVAGGTGLNPGLSEFEVYAVPSVPEAPTRVAVTEGQGQATVSWNPPQFDGGTPVIGYVVTAYLDDVPVKRVNTEENARQAVISGLEEGSSYRFTVAATNLIGTGPEAEKPVYATAIDVVGPDVITVPDSTTQYTARFTPENTTFQDAAWSVTEPDGSPTDKAVINDDGILTVRRTLGEVVITATNTDGGPLVVGSKRVRLDLDLSLVRENAARWDTATASASSEYNSDYAASRVHDGFGPSSGEWASAGEQNPWVSLAWTGPIQADRIVLYDRPGIDNANGGTLTFSDGSTIQVSAVPTNGDARTVTFEMKTFAWVRFQVQGGSGPNVGLREFEVYARPAA
ncbi:MAG TPA: glycoside hydrolase domain-containing protein [Jiangellales bacterium]|nr:glycoside hydrolase domain-containing protein [Jiangellales bacterium]